MPVYSDELHLESTLTAARPLWSTWTCVLDMCLIVSLLATVTELLIIALHSERIYFTVIK